MNANTKIRAVAFDLDGTLTDSVADLAAAANAMRAHLRLPELPQEVVQSYVGDGISVLVHRALTGDKAGQAEDALLERGLDIFIRYYAEHIADATRTYPETETALAMLRKMGLPLAVITNKSEVLSVKLLNELNIGQYFSLVVGGDTLPQRKPSPEPLRHAARVLGVEPEQMLMVGDSHNDMLAAKAAGCPCVGVEFGYGDMAQLSRDDATKPDWTVASLVDIPLRLQSAL